MLDHKGVDTDVNTNAEAHTPSKLNLTTGADALAFLMTTAAESSKDGAAPSPEHALIFGIAHLKGLIAKANKDSSDLIKALNEEMSEHKQAMNNIHHALALLQSAHQNLSENKAAEEKSLLLDHAAGRIGNQQELSKQMKLKVSLSKGS